ncbi:hypothetical protein E0E52_08010 [Azotobacter chroococcum]|uniref:hypothetical protein n=1 Tax=Azotobacter chroococcum TaxID=353 RepID=UPI0010390BDC|nr:hypothetical protein [Azotobacter chroococcum]TBW09353.1 hypothetical protein E0E52_08010 [Azotobacter chroococcum]
MVRELYTDNNLSKRIGYCSGEDLDILQEILNEPHPLYSQERHKGYESREYMAHTFLKLNGNSYEEIINHLSNVFDVENNHDSLLRKEKKLVAMFFRKASIEFSEKNILVAQKKYLKFKPDLLARNFCDEMRGHKSLGGAVFLLAGAGVSALAEKFQNFSFEDVTALAFIVKLYFVMRRRVVT